MLVMGLFGGREGGWRIRERVRGGNGEVGFLREVWDFLETVSICKRGVDFGVIFMGLLGVGWGDFGFLEILLVCVARI